MNITFKPNETLLMDLQDQFNIIGVEEGIFMTHHQLAAATNYDAEDWKQFMNHPQVRDYINEELMMYKDYQIRNMLRKADTLEKSVGAAQWMNALNKTDLGTSRDGGKAYVYMYIPPNINEQQAPNIETMTYDPFALGED